MSAAKWGRRFRLPTISWSPASPFAWGRRFRLPTCLSLLLLAAATGWAHVGSPDVFYEAQAGPYHLLVTIRTPSVIPGVAGIEVRSATNDVDVVHIVPTPLTGPGAKFAPVPDLAQRSKDDPQFFTGSLWMMTSGSWQVRVTAEGAKGKGVISVPVPALSSSTKTMQAPIGIVLAALGLVLLVGAVSIVGAGVREGQLEPGKTPNLQRAPMKTTVAVLVLLAAALSPGHVCPGSSWPSLLGTGRTTWDRRINPNAPARPARDGCHDGYGRAGAGVGRSRRTLVAERCPRL
ncbi:MAG: hypothetical protein ABSH32_19250 [Bryobacteraceae bacterium]